MKFKKLALSVMIASIIGVFGTGAYASDSSIEDNTEVVEDNTEVTEDISISVGSDLNVIISELEKGLRINLSNLTYGDIRNISIKINSNTYAFDESYKFISSLSNGENRTINISKVDVGDLSNILNTFKGYINSAFLLLFICSAFSGTVLLVLYNSGKGVKWKPLYITGFILSLSMGYLLMSSIRNNVNTETGNNYIITIPIEDGNIEVSYNRDTITFEESEYDEVIPYETVYEYDSNMLCTESEVKTEGKDGLLHNRSVITYVNGLESDSKVMESIVTEEPVNEVVVQGTKSVIQIESIEPELVYIPNDDMYVGEFENVEIGKDFSGEAEVTYSWNEDKKKVEKSSKITKPAETCEIYAGTLVREESIIPHDIEYISVDEDSGYRNVVQDGSDGKISSIYKVQISSETGEPLSNSNRELVSSERVEPITEKVEVGCIVTSEEVKPCDVVYEYDDTKWDNYEEVKEKGTDEITTVKTRVKLDEYGNLTDEVIEEISREVTSEGKTEVRIKGTKEPSWVEERTIKSEIKYNVLYQADDSLSGDEEVVVEEGSSGWVYDVNLIALDEEGNQIDDYEPEYVGEVIQKPVDRVVNVAPDSDKLPR